MRNVFREKKTVRTWIFILNVAFSIGVANCYTNPAMGFVYGIIYGVIISIIFTIVTIFTKFLVNKTGLTVWIYPVIIASLLSVFLMHKITWDPSPSKIYKRIFYKNHPDSVGNLKSYCDYPGRGSIMRLNFTIDEKELAVLLEPFKIQKNIS